MANIDTTSIMRKVANYVGDNAFVSAVSNKSSKVGMRAANKAGSTFAGMMSSAISGAGIPGVGVSSGGTRQVGSLLFEVDVNIDGALSRPSLAADRYGGIENIVALLNKGYSAGGQVYGVWQGNKIASRQSREGLGFIQKTISAFLASYGAVYNILGITCNDIYN